MSQKKSKQKKELPEEVAVKKSSKKKEISEEELPPKKSTKSRHKKEISEEEVVETEVVQKKKREIMPLVYKSSIPSAKSKNITFGDPDESILRRKKIDEIEETETKALIFKKTIDTRAKSAPKAKSVNTVEVYVPKPEDVLPYVRCLQCGKVSTNRSPSLDFYELMRIEQEKQHAMTGRFMNADEYNNVVTQILDRIAPLTEHREKQVYNNKLNELKLSVKIANINTVKNALESIVSNLLYLIYKERPSLRNPSPELVVVNYLFSRYIEEIDKLDNRENADEEEITDVDVIGEVNKVDEIIGRKNTKSSLAEEERIEQTENIDQSDLAERNETDELVKITDRLNRKFSALTEPIDYIHNAAEIVNRIIFGLKIEALGAAGKEYRGRIKKLKSNIDLTREEIDEEFKLIVSNLLRAIYGTYSEDTDMARISDLLYSRFLRETSTFDEEDYLNRVESLINNMILIPATRSMSKKEYENEFSKFESFVKNDDINRIREVLDQSISDLLMTIYEKRPDLNNTSNELYEVNHIFSRYKEEIDKVERQWKNISPIGYIETTSKLIEKIIPVFHKPYRICCRLNMQEQIDVGDMNYFAKVKGKYSHIERGDREGTKIGNVAMKFLSNPIPYDPYTYRGENEFGYPSYYSENGYSSDETETRDDTTNDRTEEYDEERTSLRSRVPLFFNVKGDINVIDKSLFLDMPPINNEEWEEDKMETFELRQQVMGSTKKKNISSTEKVVAYIDTGIPGFETKLVRNRLFRAL